MRISWGLARLIHYTLQYETWETVSEVYALVHTINLFIKYSRQACE